MNILTNYYYFMYHTWIIKLPFKFDDLNISRSFFHTSQMDDSFPSMPVEKLSETVFFFFFKRS